MSTRKTNATKATVASTPFVETVHGATPDSEATLNERLYASIKEMLATGPTWKRILTAWAVGLTVSLGLGYLGTYVAAVLAVSAALLTGSMFLFWLTYTVGLLAAIYASYRASVFVHIKIIDKSVDRWAAAAWITTTSLFSFKKARVQS